MKRLFIQSILLGICHLCFSQITTNEPPISVLKGIVSENLYTNTRIINLAVPNMVKILYEDSINSYKADMLQRCAVKIPVSINMYEYGDWIDLDDGGKLWQLSLIAKDAKSLDITFNKFWIPKGGKFFVFNPNTNETIGAVTSEYLLGNRESPHRFSTGIIKGDIITLEYYQPQSVEELPVIELSGIFYGYRVSNNKSLGFGYSGSCNINVNCAEGADWQFEKKLLLEYT